jgi:hypothetical protein
MFQIKVVDMSVNHVLFYQNPSKCKFYFHLWISNIGKFGMVERTGFKKKKYGVEVTFNAMTSLLNFIYMY